MTSLDRIQLLALCGIVVSVVLAGMMIMVDQSGRKRTAAIFQKLWNRDR
jgi:hypothetical protein